MESDLSKLFIGGISWDTDENRLKEYFGQFGEVVEVVIMRDRITGRARGFGFVIFADPAVAERVVMDKHLIDGRTVEAKKAVPRDDQQILGRKSNSIQGSPGPGRTKKIFVGGLASTVTESDFKAYFDQFGIITDVVVMYDHSTQRPRGFGFITYDSEDAVDRVLQKTFHELNGKMVEVKRAVPKELSPSPVRNPLIGLNYGLNRASNFINNYGQGYNLNTLGSGYGRFNQLVASRTGLPPFANPGYGMTMNIEPGLSGNYGTNASFGNNHGFGRALGPYFGGNSSRYNTPIGYNAGNASGESLLGSESETRNVRGNWSFNSATNNNIPGGFLGSGNGKFGVSVENGSSNWGTSPVRSQGVGSNVLEFTSGNLGYGIGDGNYRLGGGVHGRTNGGGGGGGGVSASSFVASTGGFDTSYVGLYRGGSTYGDSTWCSDSPGVDNSGSFDFGFGNTMAVSKPSESFMGNYSVTHRQAN